MTPGRLMFFFAVLLAACFGGAVAQDDPAKPVRMVVPYAAGGPPDTMTRIIAQHLSESFGQQFVIENRAGMGGIAGAARNSDMVQRFTELGIEVVGNTPEACAAQIRIDIEKYAQAVKVSGARAD